MTHPLAIPLRSEGHGRTLTGSIKLLVGIVLLSAIFSLIEITDPAMYTSYETIETIDVVVALLVLLLWLANIVIFLIWMHRLHVDLARLFDGYPTTPRRALAQLLIPIYNLWGIWRTFETLADRLKSEAGDFTRWGTVLRSWLTWLYLAGFASNVVNRLLTRQSFRTQEGSSPAELFLLSSVLDLILAIIWLQMVTIIRNAVDQRARQIPI